MKIVKLGCMPTEEAKIIEQDHDDAIKAYEDAIKENEKNALETVPKEGETGKKVTSKALKAMKLSEELFEEGLVAYDGWDPEDIELHKSIDWGARNYKEYDTGKSIEAAAFAYGGPEKQRKFVEFHKFLRPNPIYSPYYRPVEKPFEGVVGPMYDGNKAPDGYDIHNRYETQELYNILSEKLQKINEVYPGDDGFCYNIEKALGNLFAKFEDFIVDNPEHARKLASESLERVCSEYPFVGEYPFD